MTTELTSNQAKYRGFFLYNKILLLFFCFCFLDYDTKTV